MSVLIRVDSSSRIGAGHFMRCLALADEISAYQTDISFISASMDAHHMDIVKQRGYELFMIADHNDLSTNEYSLKHSDWLKGSQRDDALACIELIGDHFFDLLIVDHYALDITWECLMCKSAKGIMVIDDLADRKHDCDILLDQNFYIDMKTRYSDLVPERCRVLVGPRYSLLRKEFAVLRKKANIRDGEVKTILISFGGSDADNDTIHAVNAVSLLGGEFKAIVVIGKNHKFKEEITAACNLFDFELYVQTDQMGALMLKSDLAISSGGATTWERSCLGLPSIVYPIAFNQEKQLDDLAFSGYVYKIDKAEDQVESLVMHVRALSANKFLRASLSSRGMSLVDGRGISRTLNALGYADLSIREANNSDIGDLHVWRNHFSIRSVSHTTDPIDFDTHRKWFKNVVDNPFRVLLIAEHEDIPIGVVRFDISDNVAEVSIYLVPGENNRGSGSKVLLAAENWAKENIRGITEFRAEVVKNNNSSHKLFSNNGYGLEISKYSKQIRFANGY